MSYDENIAKIKSYLNKSYDEVKNKVILQMAENPKKESEEEIEEKKFSEKVGKHAKFAEYENKFAEYDKKIIEMSELIKNMAEMREKGKE
jgi:hypothetical protein